MEGVCRPRAFGVIFLAIGDLLDMLSRVMFSGLTLTR